jgi:hypothetical protein
MEANADGVTRAISIISLILSTASVIFTFYFSFYSSVIDRLNKFCDNFIEADRIIIDNPELNCIFEGEDFEKKQKEDPSYVKKAAFSLMNFNMFENIYHQFLSKKGIFFKSDKIAWENYIRHVLSKKVTREIWDMKETEEIYDAKYIKYINKLINKKQ